MLFILIECTQCPFNASNVSYEKEEEEEAKANIRQRNLSLSPPKHGTSCASA